MKAFISYSHADERYLERLHKHLAMLQREGQIATWYDRDILAGSVLDGTISNELDASDLFLAIVSPDYLASGYCYEKEFERALELQQAGKMRIVPIIAEPSDWLSSPLRQFMALPKDGKPISEWTNANNAFLDVITGLRKLTDVHSQGQLTPSLIATGTTDNFAPRRVKVKRDFDAIERAEFADKTFEVIKDYFASSCEELARASEDLRTRHEMMSPTAFTCTIVNRAKVGNQQASITVHNNKRRGFGDISYVFEAHAASNTSHGSIRVDADEFNLFLIVDGVWSGTQDSTRYSSERAAEWLWNVFVERAGIQYE
ncbi:toll/interleukin-1 receptor domain-containing protein [Brevundimonas lenta]|uniref:TIR domain-containing protein n=1 Tax=Brevundimonas lenta TaxID=424796 RepID=A0A7W6NND3_9CAUL|nr:toll/interleukin-1 receptor domain-containing protein [Brevundimonas lenta]MBB4081334.1 hypothetical protein [Brevundimonas lenta]